MFCRDLYTVSDRFFSELSRRHFTPGIYDPVCIDGLEKTLGNICPGSYTKEVIIRPIDREISLHEIDLSIVPDDYRI